MTWSHDLASWLGVMSWRHDLVSRLGVMTWRRHRLLVSKCWQVLSSPCGHLTMRPKWPRKVATPRNHPLRHGRCFASKSTRFIPASLQIWPFHFSKDSTRDEERYTVTNERSPMKNFFSWWNATNCSSRKIQRRKERKKKRKSKKEKKKKKEEKRKKERMKERINQ